MLNNSNLYLLNLGLFTPDGEPQGIQEKDLMAVLTDIIVKQAGQGGFTAILSNGGWINSKGDSIVEDSVMILIISSDDYSYIAEKIAQPLKERFNQEAVGLGIIPYNGGFI